MPCDRSGAGAPVVVPEIPMQIWSLLARRVLVSVMGQVWQVQPPTARKAHISRRSAREQGLCEATQGTRRNQQGEGGYTRHMIAEYEAVAFLCRESEPA